MAEHIQVFNPVNGQSYATAPTPKTSSGSIDINDNSNKIATTEWAHSAFDGAVKSVNGTTPDETGNATISFAPTIFNTRLVITSSNSAWTPPVTGWARVTVIGGGGAGGSNGNRGGQAGGDTSFGKYITALGGPGGGGTSRTTNTCGSAGGGAGNVESAYVYLNSDTSIRCTIGAGGIISTTDNTAATGNGAPDFVPGSATSYYTFKNAMSGGRYPGGNGNIGNIDSKGSQGLGGSGGSNGTAFGGGGGGSVSGLYLDQSSPGVGGGNGSDGTIFTSNVVQQCNGGNGGSGAIIIEYYDPTKEVA